MAAAAAGGVVRLRPSLRHGMRPYSESGTGRTNGGAETSLRPGRRMPSPSRDGGARSGWTRFHTARYRWPQPRLRGKTYQETGSRKRSRNPDPSAEHNDTNPEPPVSRPGGLRTQRRAATTNGPDRTTRLVEPYLFQIHRRPQSSAAAGRCFRVATVARKVRFQVFAPAGRVHRKGRTAFPGKTASGFALRSRHPAPEPIGFRNRDITEKRISGNSIRSQPPSAGISPAS